MLLSVFFHAELKVMRQVSYWFMLQPIKVTIGPSGKHFLSLKTLTHTHTHMRIYTGKKVWLKAATVDNPLTYLLFTSLLSLLLVNFSQLLNLSFVPRCLLHHSPLFYSLRHLLPHSCPHPFTNLIPPSHICVIWYLVTLLPACSLAHLPSSHYATDVHVRTQMSAKFDWTVSGA